MIRHGQFNCLETHQSLSRLNLRNAAGVNPDDNLFCDGDGVRQNLVHDRGAGDLPKPRRAGLRRDDERAVEATLSLSFLLWLVARR